MILITLGTQDKPFNRLLEKIDQLIDEGAIKEEVIVQAGFTKYASEHMQIFDYIDIEEFNEYLNKADLIITHGGVGTIMSALALNKKIIAVARLARYGEHHNDHQVQILETFSENGYLLYVEDLKDLKEYLGEIKNFIPKKYVSNTLNMIKLIKDYIN